jgi:hypothetical protein
MKAVSVTALQAREKHMTRLMTQYELDRLTLPELRAKLSELLSELPMKQQIDHEYQLMIASIQNIQTSLRRRRMQQPKL